MESLNEVQNTCCPCCYSSEFIFWASERGFVVSRCKQCDILLLNPMPDMESVALAVGTGFHVHDGITLNVRSRRIEKKVTRYRQYFVSRFNDICFSGQPITWLDVGCGYGEVLEAVSGTLPQGSSIVGVEPMQHKVEAARACGLEVISGYLEPYKFKANVISMIDIFSHIWDFRTLLKVASTNIAPGGEVFIETGNLADLSKRDEFPGELGLPDHMIFGGERHIVKYLTDAGFEIVFIDRIRIDTVGDFFKNIIKKLIGRPIHLRLPYRSKYRSLRIRAKYIAN